MDTSTLKELILSKKGFIIVFLFIIVLISAYFVFILSKKNQPAEIAEVDLQKEREKEIAIKKDLIDENDYIEILINADEKTHEMLNVSSLINIKKEDLILNFLDDKYTLSLKSDPSLQFFPSSVNAESLLEDSWGNQSNNNRITSYVKLTFKIKKVYLKDKINNQMNYTNSISLIKAKKKFIAKAATSGNIDFEFLHTNTGKLPQNKVLDIVIMTCGYDRKQVSDYEKFDFNKATSELAKSILNGPFFQNYKNSYNIIRVNNKFSNQYLDCKAPDRTTGDPGLNEVLVKSISSQINGDAIIVFGPNIEFYSRASRPDYDLSIDSDNRYVNPGIVKTNLVYDNILCVNCHELCHSIGKCDDEYVYTEYAGDTIYPYQDIQHPNCKSSNSAIPSEFQPNTPYVGCTVGRAFRSTQNSLMRHDSRFPNPDKFNALTEKYLKKALCVLAPVSCSASTDPTDPGNDNPTDPGDPTNPTDPGDDPTPTPSPTPNPTDPTNPTNPNDPTNPTNPTNPGTTQPTQITPAKPKTCCNSNGNVVTDGVEDTKTRCLVRIEYPLCSDGTAPTAPTTPTTPTTPPEAGSECKGDLLFCILELFKGKI